MENGLAVMNGGTNMLAAIGNEIGNAFCTIPMETPGVREAVFNGLQAPNGKLAELAGKIVRIKDVYGENVEGVNDETGEVEQYTRLVLFMVDGTAYTAAGKGIKNALRTAFTLYGTPTWEGGLAFEVVPVPISKDRNTYTLRRVAE